MSDFPSQVNANQAPGVEGDFASANPRKTVLAGEGALIAGLGVIAGASVAGIVVGRWAWASFNSIDNDEAPGTVNTFGAGLPIGLVHREQIGLITQYLASASMVLLQGQQAVVFNDVDLWVKNTGAACLVGQKAFANFADGTTYFAAAGATPPGGSGSASSVAASTFSGTGSVVDNLLTITGSVVGTIVAGGTISGTGVTTNSKIISQVTPLLAGEALGGIGRYRLNIGEQNAASTAISGTYGTLTVGGTVVAGFAAGQSISGASVVAGTTIYSQLTGTAGGAGTYVVDNNTVVSSTAITAQNSIETPWIAKSAGATGELIKVSRTS